MIWFAYAMAWLSTAIAVSCGIYYTHSAWCLWALFIPACIKVTKDREDEDNNEEVIKKNF